MKARLLKRLREKGRNQILVHSITKTNGLVTGMSYGYDDDRYSGLFSFGDSEESVLKKAETIYIADYLSKLPS